tara:strand:- start:215 stop:553 length:339 start_codon:yes stop_codon:yes gene_type:complete
MQELVLNELKVYAKEVNSKAMQGVRQHGRKLGLSKQFVNIYSKRDPHPLSECSEYYLDDKEFIKKAINIDLNSIKFASKRLRQDKTIAKLILKKDKKLADKYIFKKTLKEIL